MMLVQGPGGTLVVKVLATEKPTAGAQVIVNGQTFVADATGEVRLTLPAGAVEVRRWRQALWLIASRNIDDRMAA
jgi:hypothetical protein